MFSFSLGKLYICIYKCNIATETTDFTINSVYQLFWQSFFHFRLMSCVDCKIHVIKQSMPVYNYEFHQILKIRVVFVVNRFCSV